MSYSTEQPKLRTDHASVHIDDKISPSAKVLGESNEHLLARVVYVSGLGIQDLPPKVSDVWLEAVAEQHGLRRLVGEEWAIVARIEAAERTADNYARAARVWVESFKVEGSKLFKPDPQLLGRWSDARRQWNEFKSQSHVYGSWMWPAGKL